MRANPMAVHAQSYETILQYFRSNSGLYILGAGASAGMVPFGASFLSTPAVSYVLGASFPADIPQQSELTRRSNAALLRMNAEDRHALLFGGREIRVGTTDYPYEELLRRQPDSYTRLQLKHLLATPRYRRQESDSYLALRLFRRAVILNYNLDGLASDMCGAFHKVIAAHGTVEHGYGSPRMAEYLMAVREFNLPVPPDDHLLCLAEPDINTDAYFRLRRRLSEAMGARPEFVAVIGYSFGRNGNLYDDHVSWNFFCRMFYKFAGRIYVIDPKPDELRERISEAAKSCDVFGVRAYWNVLVHAFMRRASDNYLRTSLNYIHEQLLDAYGSGAVFPQTPALAPRIG
jgi:hypothetical protein